MINSVVGCLYCDTSANYYRNVAHDDVTGMDVMTCVEIEDPDNYESLENVRCPDLGYISELTGYIEEEQTLQCTHCS